MDFAAIGLIELNSIARGILIHDLMAKRASVKILQSHTICPGKYFVLIGGGVAEVEESMGEGLHYGGSAVVDSLFIPNITESIFPAMVGATQHLEIDSVVIVETFTIASAVELADMALKRTRVQLLDLRLAQGIGGKAYFLLTGPLYEAEEAKRYVEAEAEPGMLTNVELIAAPHEDTVTAVGGRII
jgi:microcompartment protein CcmL/EutN